MCLSYNGEDPDVIDARYLYGRDGDLHRFHYAEMGSTTVDNLVGVLPESSPRQRR